MDTLLEKPRLRNLLDHFSDIADPREPWRVAHPLREVLLLVVCGTIASCDDFDDIAEWGEAHLSFLRGLLPYHFGIPGARWLNILMNRIDPKLFAACFMAWARELRPNAPDVIAFDGKTSRRTHDRSAGKAALHLVSAFATAERLVLGQEAVADKSCEQEAIPELIDKLAASGTLDGAVVTIDAIACNPKIATSIIEAVPTMSWPSRTTSQASGPRSSGFSPMHRPPASMLTATSTRATAASRSAAAGSHPTSAGLKEIAAFPVNIVFPNSPPSP